MFASRRDENAIHARQAAAAAAKTSGAKTSLPKTPLKQTSKTPFRGRQYDENAITFKKGDGKVKDAVAALEGKAARTSVNSSTPAAILTRAPLGLKTANGKTNAFQTPAPRVLTQKPAFGASSPRLRKAKFQVHETKTENANIEPEEREIEYMYPREVPLPDYPDDDVWPHDRVYPQFTSPNFTRGWALEFMNEDEDESFDTKMKHFEADAVRPSRPAKQSSTKTRSDTAPGTITSVKAVSALSGIRGVSNFAAATTSSTARAKRTLSEKPATNLRHTAAKSASNTTIGYSKGRTVSTTNRASPNEGGFRDDCVPLTAAERSDVLNAMWHHGDTSDDDEDDFYAPMLDNIDFHGLKSFGSEIPDD